jgi:hypothetical protein
VAGVARQSRFIHVQTGGSGAEIMVAGVEETDLGEDMADWGAFAS